ncbi:MAG TPA: UbiA family prenyltransferase [Allosphingosinicella sp.]|nr:UbiA family prenyltransferase [Allosphingosinicella sp.]
MPRFSSILPYWKHLRLHFQLALAPLFLWGFFLGGGRAGATPILAFASLHFFLYPGITAFNSAYDRDAGPVSGLREPPPVPPGLLAFSILLQLAGAAIALAAGPRFLVIYAAIAVLAALYSHPAVRLKARPFASAATVAIGQGALGFAAGWFAASPAEELWTERGALGAAGAALTTLGLYPATQVFQTGEDSRRGDRTLAVVLGPARALRLGGLCLLAAGAVTVLLAARQFGAVDTALLATAFGAMLLNQESFARATEGGRLTAAAMYRRAMRSYYLSAAGLLLFIGYRALFHS